MQYTGGQQNCDFVIITACIIQCAKMMVRDKTIVFICDEKSV